MLQIANLMFGNFQANPHKRLRHLYGSRMMNQYRNVALGELSPHVYAIAEQVSTMLLDAKSHDCTAACSISHHAHFQRFFAWVHMAESDSKLTGMQQTTATLARKCMS